MDLHVGANLDFLKNISRNGNWNCPLKKKVYSPT